MEKMVRLDRFLADAGVGTRSEVKKKIQKGFIQVNGQVIRRPEQKVTPGTDIVAADGKAVPAAPRYVYYLLNKPAGYISATEDGRERTVLELLPEDSRRNLFPVGRLDKDTEGLLLITDDGPLAHELLSPKKHVDKTYYARIEGKAEEEDIRRIAAGLDIGEETPTLPAKLEILRVYAHAGEEKDPQEVSLTAGKTQRPEQAGIGPDSGWESEILLTIHEGKYHQVKRMMEALGKKVLYLKRLSMGTLTLPEDLPAGRYRMLTKEELAQLKGQR